MSDDDKTVPSTTRTAVAVSACDSYDPAAVDAALDDVFAVIGGIESIVRPGATVLVKPNLVSPRPPEKAVTTHPAVVAAVVRRCRAAGAARVWVGDSCAGNHSDATLWERTGMRDAVTAAGGILRSFTDGEVRSVPAGSRSVPCPTWLSAVDTVISVPKFKTHFLTTLSVAMKNAYGMIPGEAKALYHGIYPSPATMSRFLVDVFAAFRPDLVIVDGIVAMEGNGPTNGRPVGLGLLLGGRDAVAVDTVCARIAGIRPASVAMIRLAGERGLGETAPERIDVAGTGAARCGHGRLRLSQGRFLQMLPERLYRVLAVALRYYPDVDASRCIRCGACVRVCSQSAISAAPGAVPKVDRRQCIVCMCCMESCPRDAIYATALGGMLLRLIRGRRQRAPDTEAP